MHFAPLFVGKDAAPTQEARIQSFLQEDFATYLVIKKFEMECRRELPLLHCDGEANNVPGLGNLKITPALI